MNRFIIMLCTVCGLETVGLIFVYGSVLSSFVFVCVLCFSDKFHVHLHDRINGPMKLYMYVCTGITKLGVHKELLTGIFKNKTLK